MNHKPLCTAGQVSERGPGFRFELLVNDTMQAAFLVRYNGTVYGWLNRCPHQRSELDWIPGVFFDDEGDLLVCATHGAHFRPDTGTCVGGPCSGGLQSVAVFESDGLIYLAQ